MKKRLLLFVVMLAMMVGFSFHAYAQETRHFEGTGKFDSLLENDDAGVQDALNLTMDLSEDQFRMSFTGAANGMNYDIIATVESISGTQVILSAVNVNGIDCLGEEYNTFQMELSEHSADMMYSKISFIHSNGKTIYLYMEFKFEEVLEPEVYQISSPFTGVAESDNGEYTLALAGHFTGLLTDGTHELSAEVISTQTAAIVAYRKENGVKRVMRENTIEEMTVTVRDGRITEYRIRGRVQTDGGTLDRYTAVIN